MRIYLAGPIANLSHEQASQWRLYVETALPEFEVFNPMVYNNDTENDNLPNYNGTKRGGEIWQIDKTNLENSDLILANFTGSEKVSIGTAVEIGMAVQLNIPIIVVMENNNIHRHPFICVPAEFVCDNLDKAIDYCKFILEFQHIKF